MPLFVDGDEVEFVEGLVDVPDLVHFIFIVFADDDVLELMVNVVKQLVVTAKY